jgi:hypothetical protein
MSPKNPDDEAGKDCEADIRSYRRPTILDNHDSGITTEDAISSQTGRISQKKVDKIKNNMQRK